MVSQENNYVLLHYVAVEHLFNTFETCYHNNLIDIKWPVGAPCLSTNVERNGLTWTHGAMSEQTEAS